VRQWSHQVDVQVCKPAVRDWYVLWLQMYVVMSFPTLTAQARPGGGGGLFLHMRPAEGGGNQAARSSYSRMMNIVQRSDGGLSKLGGQERSEHTS
jgi:hypothetical protein